MTLYCDSSSLFKLFQIEPYTRDVQQLFAAASTVVTSSIAFVEIRAALGRLYRERRLTKPDLMAATRQLTETWSGIVLVVPSPDVISTAGDLAERHGLRALDSIHVASFQQVLERTDDHVEFSSFDERLNKAARKLR